MSEDRFSKKRKLLVMLIFAAATIAFLAILHSWSMENNKRTLPNPVIAPQLKVAVIEVTPSGFVPKTLSIQPGTKVMWLNEDVKPHLPEADPFPSHKSLPNLISPMALGQKNTYSYLFTKPGTVGYHDQINPTLTGTIVIRHN